MASMTPCCSNGHWSETEAVLAEYEAITLERLKEVQAQTAEARVKVAEADALDTAVQLLEDFQVSNLPEPHMLKLLVLACFKF